MAETLGAILDRATETLKRAGVEGARRDARLLAGHVLALDAAALIAHPERPVPEAKARALAAAVARRAAREPVSRILGRREFYGLDFALSPATLDPRPDSETVVEAALAALSGRPRARVLDLGTGTGCLLLAVLAHAPAAAGTGIDAAAGAVETARTNAASLGLGARARFLVRDWDRPDWQDGLDGPFDLVLANPPYIPAAEIAHLAPEVARHDPVAALDGGDDGLDAYRRLIPGLFGLLVPGGTAVFEIGLGQGDAVAALFAAAGFAPGGIRPDLAGIPRAAVARRPAA